MNTSRSANTVRNIYFGLMSKIVNLIFPFIIRTIILNKLGAEYAGIGSLFTSILQVLSVAELGFSSAIVFSLYEPIANKNDEEICSYLLIYKRIYQVVGLVISFLGILIMPFIRFLINGEYPSDVNLYLLYIIYLSNTTISYFVCGYKNVIFVAHQRQNVISMVEIIINLIRSVVQITVLVICSSYYLYIIFLPIFTLVSNILIYFLSRKYYPALICKGKIDHNNLKRISKPIKGVALGKFSLTTRNTFDSIILSALCGLTKVAMYSNYYYIFNAVGVILGVLLQSMSASIGNSIVKETIEKNYQDYLKFDFYYMGLASWCCTFMTCLYQPFMKIWVGEELVLPYHTMILFCVYFYVNQLAQIRSVYSEAVGLWWEFRYVTIFEMVSNLVLNIVLGICIGIDGIILATIITAFISSFILLTTITFKKYFKHSPKKYFLNNAVYALVTLLTSVLCVILCSTIRASGIIGIVARFIICLIMPGVVFAVIYCNVSEYKKYILSIKSIIKNIR